MINPNTVYKVKPVGIITSIDPVDSYIPYLKVTMPDGCTIEGSLKRCHSQWERLKVGDRVSVNVQYSIMAEAYRIESVIRKR